MSGGTIGDSPYTDIIHHGLDIYSPRAAALVREIAMLADETTRRKLADQLLHDFNTYRHPDVPRLEALLVALRDQCLGTARTRGFEVD